MSTLKINIVTFLCFALLLQKSTSSPVEAELVQKEEVYEDGQIVIQSPRVTPWGTWGELQTCPELHYVYGMRLKVQNPQSILGDDTALNGIELLCISATGREGATESKSFTTITSKVGHAGAWGVIRECPFPLFAVGFQLRSEPNKLVADDTAGNDVRLICSGGQVLEGYGFTTWGSWTEERTCPRGTELCGLKTQVEDEGASDDTSLNNIDMVCCGIP